VSEYNIVVACPSHGDIGIGGAATVAVQMGGDFLLTKLRASGVGLLNNRAWLLSILGHKKYCYG
jgi:hypothetical protein